MYNPIPLRKTDKIAEAVLTSYIAKLFVVRNPLSKYNFTTWIQRNFANASLDMENRQVTNPVRGNNHIPSDKTLPRIYTSLMASFNSFKSLDGNWFCFEYAHRDTIFDKKDLDRENKNYVICGKDKDGNALYMDLHGDVYVYKNGMSLLGGFLSITGDWGKAPVEHATIKNMNYNRCPILLMLLFHYGFNKTLRKIKAMYRTEAANIRSTATYDEYAVEFRDERFLFKKGDPVCDLILGGFEEIKNTIREYNPEDLVRGSVFNNLLTEMGLNNNHYKEMRFLFDGMIDPITADILKNKMHEPTDLASLLIRCTELIAYDRHPTKSETMLMRTRGMERFGGYLAAVLAKAAKDCLRAPNPANQVFKVGPRDLWMLLTQDQTTQLEKCLNPIHYLKERESVSLTGRGGQSSRTLTKEGRAFNKGDVGQYSEATPASGKVGVRVGRPQNPLVDDIYGFANGEEFSMEKYGNAGLMSTTASVIPSMDKDDGKNGRLKTSLTAGRFCIKPCLNLVWKRTIVKTRPGTIGQRVPSAANTLSLLRYGERSTTIESQA